MTTHLTIAGITFHAYGLVVGIAGALGWWLVEKKAAEHHLPLKALTRVMFLGIGGAFLGARGWHVATDWPSYQADLMGVFAVWNGGLSIVGALVGGALGGWLGCRWTKVPLGQVSDAVAFGLPVSQAVGRAANYLNQELYGLPTQLPWGIPIDSAHRLPEVAAFTKFHPLFAYEAGATGLFAAWLWLVDQTPHRKQLFGRGWYAMGYLWYYAVLRFSLDFLRVGPLYWHMGGLGWNQWAMLLLALGTAVWLWQRIPNRLVRGVLISGLLWLGVWWLAAPTVLGFKGASLPIDQAIEQTKYDHRPLVIALGGQERVVEVVNSAPSITRGLSQRASIPYDGMLFILPQRTVAHFWMYQMQFDLDLVWIDRGTVVGVTAQVPHPLDMTTTALPTYQSPQAVEWVLEIPAGKASEWHLTPGETVLPLRWL